MENGTGCRPLGGGQGACGRRPKALGLAPSPALDWAGCFRGPWLDPHSLLEADPEGRHAENPRRGWCNFKLRFGGFGQNRGGPLLAQQAELPGTRPRRAQLRLSQPPFSCALGGLFSPRVARP